MTKVLIAGVLSLLLLPTGCDSKPASAPTTGHGSAKATGSGSAKATGSGSAKATGSGSAKATGSDASGSGSATGSDASGSGSATGSGSGSASGSGSGSATASDASGTGSGSAAASATFADADVLGFFSHLTVGLSSDGKTLAFFDVTVGDPNSASAAFVDISGATPTPVRSEPFSGIDPEGMKVDAAFIANRVTKVNKYLAGMQPLAGVGFKKNVASLKASGATTKVAFDAAKHVLTLTPPSGKPVTTKVDDGGGVTTPTPIAAFALPGGRAAVIMQYRGDIVVSTTLQLL